MPELGLVVLQPTPFCNISCKYCYLPQRASTARMSLETVERIFSNVFSSGWVGDKLDVAWHAGEPLVLPIEFYEDAIGLINAMVPNGIDVRHNFQTNGTLVNADWCDFFDAANVGVGISIDGPRALNDSNRVTRSGKSSFDDALDGIRQLKAHNIDFHVITVLSKGSLSSARELYRFYQAEGIRNVCFNVEEIEGIHSNSSLSEVTAQEQYANFLREFWNLNVEFKAISYIREFANMFRSIVVPPGTSIRNTLAEPFAILNVDHLGNFSTFCPELLGNNHEHYADYLAGNVWDHSLKSAFEKDAFNRLIRDVRAGVEACRRECDYFGVCGGGAPANKIFENMTPASTETLACRLSVQTVANVAMEILETSATDAIVEAGMR